MVTHVLVAAMRVLKGLIVMYSALQCAAQCAVSLSQRACVFGTQGVGLKVHQQPSLTAPIVTIAPEGESFNVTSLPTNASGWAGLSNEMGVAGFASCAFLSACGGTADTWNRFGIGMVDGGNDRELSFAQGMGGPGGYVLLIFVGVTNTTTAPQQEWLSMISDAYSKSLTPVVRLGQAWGDSWREMTDDPSLRSYHGLGAAIAAVVGGLPKPKGQKLFVQVGNEVDLGYEFYCKTASPAPLPFTEIAAEYASLFRDAAAAIEALDDPWIRVAAAPMAPGGLLRFGCCGQQNCPGDAPGILGTQFQAAMAAAVPGIWQRVHWLASHAYPASKPGCCFNVPYGSALPGLQYYESELETVNRSVQVIVSETGWATHRQGLPTCSEQDKATWTVQAYQGVWGADPRIAGVTPFMLAGPTWGDADGYGYVKADYSSTYPVYDAVKALRCQAFPQDC